MQHRLWPAGSSVQICVIKVFGHAYVVVFQFVILSMYTILSCLIVLSADSTFMSWILYSYI